MGCAHHCEWSGGGARPSLALGGVMVGYGVWVLVTFWSLLWAVHHCLSWAVVAVVAGTYCCSAVCFLWWWVIVVGVHVCGELLVVAVGGCCGCSLLFVGGGCGQSLSFLCAHPVLCSHHGHVSLWALVVVQRNEAISQAVRMASHLYLQVRSHI